MKLITYRLRGAEHVGALTADGTAVAAPALSRYEHPH